LNSISSISFLLICFRQYEDQGFVSSEFLNVGIEDECLKDVGAFCENLDGAFVSRDIGFSWVDVRHELEGGFLFLD
jgi:hypothetical protein